MPTINLPKKRKYKKRIKKNDAHRYVYNTRMWKNIRLTHLLENPLCENCKKNNKLTLATEVHHIYEISNGKTIQEKQQIGFDTNNLMSLCNECHINIHK